MTPLIIDDKLIRGVIRLRGDIVPPGVSVISHYKPFENQPFHGQCQGQGLGSIHLEVCWMDRSTSLTGGLQKMLLIYQSCIQSDTPTCDKTQEKADFQMACDHTHTWWHNKTALIYFSCCLTGKSIGLKTISVNLTHYFTGTEKHSLRSAPTLFRLSLSSFICVFNQ